MSCCSSSCLALPLGVIVVVIGEKSYLRCRLSPYYATIFRELCAIISAATHLVCSLSFSAITIFHDISDFSSFSRWKIVLYSLAWSIVLMPPRRILPLLLRSSHPLASCKSSSLVVLVYYFCFSCWFALMLAIMAIMRGTVHHHLG